MPRRKLNQHRALPTKAKLYTIILKFLDAHEEDMVADYRPTSEQWRQLLAESLAEYIASAAINVPSE